MKLNKLALLLSMFVMGISAAQAAAPTAELKVKGVISPGSCTVTAPDNGEYDFGRISADRITTGDLFLTDQVKNWVVTCDADTTLTYTVVDNRPGTSNKPLDYVHGLGRVNGTGKIGGYIAKMSNGKVDGQAVRVFGIPAASSTLPSGAEQIVYLDSTMKHGWMHGSNQVLASGKVFTTDVEVQAHLGSVTDMNGPVTSDVNLDGSLTLNFAYGI